MIIYSVFTYRIDINPKQTYFPHVEYFTNLSDAENYRDRAKKKGCQTVMRQTRVNKGYAPFIRNATHNVQKLG